MAVGLRTIADFEPQRHGFLAAALRADGGEPDPCPVLREPE
jgi:hypothetical protein